MKKKVSKPKLKLKNKPKTDYRLELIACEEYRLAQLSYRNRRG